MAKPDEKPKVVFREAIDLRQRGNKWQVVKVLYGGGLSEESIWYESESGTMAAARFLKAAAAHKAQHAVSGLPPEGGEALPPAIP